MNALTIGQVAKLAEVGVETIRFYEREGLIAEPERRISGYRQYGHDAVKRIRFIRQAKQFGFSLKEIKNLISIRTDPRSGCEDVLASAREKLSEIEGKILELEQMRHALRELADGCPGSGPTSDCPILGGIEKRANADD